MSFCPYCGSKVDDDSVFCPSCGKKIGEDYRSESTAIVVKEGASTSGGMVPEIPVRNNAKLIGIIVVLAVAIVAIFAGIKIFGALFSGRDTSKFVTWYNSNGYYMKKNMADGKDDTDIQIASIYNNDGSYEYAMSDNGKYFAYIKNMDFDDDEGTLCLSTLGKLSKNSSNGNAKYNVEVDSHVYVFGIYACFDDGSIVYSKRDSDDEYHLYYWNGKESVCFAGDVYSVYYAEEDGVIFTKDAADDSYTGYYWEIGSKDDPKKIFSNASSIYVKDINNIAYSTPYDDEDCYSIYTTSSDADDATKVADGVYGDDLYSVYERSGKFTYYIKTQETSKISDYFSDVTYDEDIKVQEPDRDNPKYQKSSGWWTSYTEEYYDLLGKYEAAQLRIQTEQDIQGITFEHDVYNMYEYADGKSTEISTNVDYEPSYNSISGDSYIHTYFKHKSGDKSISVQDILDEIGEWYDDDDLQECAAEIVNSSKGVDYNTLYFTVSGGSEQSVSIDLFELGFDVTYCNATMFNNGESLGLLFEGTDDNGESVYSDVYVGKISNNKVSKFDSAKCSGSQIYNIFKDGEYLFAHSEYELYMYTGSEFVVLDDDLEDTGWLQAYADGKVRYISDFTDDDIGGTLYEVDSKGNKEKIADNVKDYTMLANGDTLYITANDVLELYDGKKEKRVSGNVENVIIGEDNALEKLVSELNAD